MHSYRQARIKKNLQLRAQIIQAVRQFFYERDYLEVETPCRVPVIAPEAHIDAEMSGGWFLHTSPELSMKRLLSAGYPRIFQICKCFRAKERGLKHLPEFTLLEWYGAGMDYVDMMAQCENLLRFVARALGSECGLVYQGRPIDLTPPWERLTVVEAFHLYASQSLEEALLNDCFDEAIAFEIEPRLGNEKPVFLYDYPAQKGALARLKPDNPNVAQRFELYICGLELCNAFTELVDPVEQRRRFEIDGQVRAASGKKAVPMPEKFLKSLDDMPPAAGNALGLDRLVMLFSDAARIDDVVAFTPEEL
ncbi:MAG: EF-P lysine aminoacylase EpmA [Desulfobacterales bacterium]|nr:EF-P lysine aminoacylase EpmA [Desulfobacterales bacterium]